MLALRASLSFPMPARPFLKPICSVITGALLTIATATVPPLFSVLDPISAQPPLPGTSWPCSLPADTPPPSNVITSASSFARQRDFIAWRIDPSSTSRAQWLATEYRAGWPLPALRAAYAQESSYLQTTRGLRRGGRRTDLTPGLLAHGIPLPDLITDHVNTLNDTIPIQPLFPGLLVNTALYAAITFLLLSTPSFIRRTSRKRRHACLRCGYDIQTLPRCPECGTLTRGTLEPSLGTGCHESDAALGGRPVPPTTDVR